MRANDGTGQIVTARNLYETGVDPRSIAIGDVDGDGKPDVVTSNYQSGDCTPLLGKGDGTFSGPRNFSPGHSSWGLALADLNGDERADAVFPSNAAPDILNVLLSEPVPSPMVAFCFPGSDGVRACPCGNPPTSLGRGCNNFGAHSGGATLSGAGLASLSGDTLVFTASGENATPLTVFLQGKTPVAAGVVFGAGVRCLTTNLKRLYSGSAAGGIIQRPRPTDPSVSARSAALGDPISSGPSRYYTAYYRDPSAAGPCGNAAASFNSTQSGSVIWRP